jgi:hypothetical protein
MGRSARLAVAIGAVAVSACRAEAQTVLLRFRPPVGTRVHTLWQVEVQSTLTEGAGLPVLRAEAAGMRSISSRVLELRDDARVVRVERDSARYRWRAAAGPWVAVADTGSAAPSALLVVDDRLRVSESGTPAPAGARSELRAFAGGLETPLPEGPVAAGDSWSADIVVPLVEPTGLEDEPDVGRWLARADAMVARSTFTVDSLVDRGRDTLAYLVVRGTFLPATQVAAVEAAEGRSRLDGTFAGQFIWSTGWQAYVSGAVRIALRLQVLRGLPPDEEVSYGMISEISSRFRVRQ